MKKYLTLFAVVFMALLLCSCDLRMSEGQAQQLAQAREDINASSNEPDATQRLGLMAAANNRVLAAVANLELPEPITNAQDLTGPANKANAEKEAQEANSAKHNPPEGPANYPAIAGGIGLFGIGLAMRLGLLGPFGNILLSAVTPLAKREQQKSAGLLEEAAKAAVAYGHKVTTAAQGAGINLEDIKSEAIAANQSLGIDEIMSRLITEQKLKSIREEMSAS